MKQNESSKISPPYIPLETLKNFLGTLKSSTVPNRIESSMMPATMSGFNKAGVTSALRFFSLINSDGETTNELKELVDAYETNKWPEAVKTILVSAYRNIIGDLQLNTAIRKELDEKFEGASSTMKDRFIRFYIPLLQEASVEVSPYLTARQNKPRKSGPRKPRKKQKRDAVIEKGGSDAAKPPPTSNAPDGMFDLPMMTITPDSFIRVPVNMTPDQVAVVKAAAEYLAIMAQQNKGSK